MEQFRVLDIEQIATAEAAKALGVAYLAERDFEDDDLPLRVRYLDAEGHPAEVLAS